MGPYSLLSLPAIRCCKVPLLNGYTHSYRPIIFCFLFYFWPQSTSSCSKSRPLTPPLLLHAPLTLFLAPLGLFHLLVLAALVEVLHHHADEHVEHEEADDEEEGDEVEQHPRVVVGDGLEGRRKGGRFQRVE